MIQEDKLQIQKTEAEFETKILAANPDLWMEMYGAVQEASPVDENNIFFPGSDEEFEEMLHLFEQDGWILEG